MKKQDSTAPVMCFLSDSLDILSIYSTLSVKKINIKSTISEIYIVVIDNWSPESHNNNSIILTQSNFFPRPCGQFWSVLTHFQGFKFSR